jgi:hypothetical protein
MPVTGLNKPQMVQSDAQNVSRLAKSCIPVFSLDRIETRGSSITRVAVDNQERGFPGHQSLQTEILDSQTVLPASVEGRRATRTCEVK